MKYRPLSKLKISLFFVLFFFSSAALLSQEIIGRVYDDDSALSGVTVLNKAQKEVIITNDKGEFSIKATVNDTLIFQSSFHQEQKKIITEDNRGEFMIIELKNNINTLDEVLLSGKENEFDAEKYSIDLKQQIQKDIENNPLDYGVATSGGVSLIGLVKLAISIFKKKPEKKIIYATQIDLILLFKEDEFFTEKLLKKTLKIPKEFKNLFLDYCAAKQIEENLLKEENKFQLLDILVVCSNEFREIVAEYEKEK